LTFASRPPDPGVFAPTEGFGRDRLCLVYAGSRSSSSEALVPLAVLVLLAQLGLALELLLLLLCRRLRFDLAAHIALLLLRLVVRLVVVLDVAVAQLIPQHAQRDVADVAGARLATSGSLGYSSSLRRNCVTSMA
jgi:hypothetical protein